MKWKFIDTFLYRSNSYIRNHGITRDMKKKSN